MTIVHNFPFFSIMLCLITGIISPILKPKTAKTVSIGTVGIVMILSAATLNMTLGLHQAYPFMMGHFPAPWGNEIRIGQLEALVATGFSAVMFITLIAGFHHSLSFVGSKKYNLYCIMLNLALAAILVMIYTNDLFTVFVFVEIMTIASVAMAVVRQDGITLVAGTRYMIMHLLASGMLLLGISMLYGITGHLLMEPLQIAVRGIYESGEYMGPLTVVIALITTAFTIKSAMFPFHAWAPDIYAYAPPMSSAILSGIISKAYIFIVMKFFYRVIGMDIIVSQKISTALFYCGIAGMIIGSVMAIGQREIRRMVGYSSIAQIGYIYMGLGLGTQAGVQAAVFQMLAHSAAKSLLFLSVYELINVSGDHKRFRYLHGAGYRNIPAGIVFTVGAMSMVGIPFTGGFIVKLSLATAGMPFGGGTRALVLISLAVSTLLNAVYFLRTVVNIYRHAPESVAYPQQQPMPRYVAAALFVSMLFTIYLGVGSEPVIRVIETGLKMFS